MTENRLAILPFKMPLDVAQPGSVIRIQAGTYPEQISIEKNKFPNATEFDRIIVEADPALQPGQVVLTGAPGPQCTERWAIRIKQSKFITIRGLTITGTGGQAISLMGGNNGNQEIHIELNRIFGNGSNSCNGGITIARGNPGTLIVNNLLYSNGRNAITFEDADGGPHYIINNTIYGNSGTVLMWREITRSRLPTTSSIKTVLPPDPPVEDSASEGKVPTIRNPQGSSCATISCAATRLARLADRCWTPRTPAISPPKEVKAWG